MIEQIAGKLTGVSSDRAPSDKMSSGPNFKDTLKEAITDVNALQKDSKAIGESFVSGEITDLHQVMLSAEKARVGLELMLEIRNKMVEGYQEIMRMQI